MDNAIYEYIKNGITINGNPIDGYTVFTIPTQHFKIDNLDELTSEIFKEVQKEIDQEILNQLRGGEPNPDFIPMNTTDRLFHKFLDAPDPDADPDVIWGKNQFVNMLLTDDDFYQKWGENCCEELTYEERYKYWFSHNYETGFEYTPTIEPDFDNDYFEPTPKRKLK